MRRSQLRAPQQLLTWLHSERLRSLSFRRRQSAKRAAAVRVRQLVFELCEDRRMLAGIDLTPQEQLVLELVNRARNDPAAEASRFGIGLNDGLTGGTISPTPKQPLAPNQLLVNAARLHSQDMLDRDYFDHINPQGKNPGARIADAGYVGSGWGENIAWNGSTGAVDQTALAFALHEGLFRSPSHRTNIMSANFDELGNGLKFGVFTFNGVNYNAGMLTENFGISSNKVFITGIAYTDSVQRDSFYTVGEGIGNVTVAAVTAGGLRFETTTGNSGGYSLQVPSGTYTVSFTGGAFTQPAVFSNVVVQSSNIKVDATPIVAAALQLAIAPTTISESGGTTTGTVTRTGSTAAALTINLSSGDTSEATVPGSVTIPAGASSATFTITAVDDTLVDGSQQVVISASATGISPVTATITVTDNDVAAALTLTLAASTITEKGTTTGTVTRNGPTNSDLVVTLTSSDTSEARVPPSITIPAGSSSATFTITGVDDAEVDGTQNVTISATATGFPSVTAALSVTDDEQAALGLLLLVGSISELGGTASATVSRNSSTSTSLTIQLSSSDTTEATVPSTITIPAGSTSVTFVIAAVDDTVADGNQVVTITATATGHTPATGTVTVIDNEQAGLTLSFSPTTISEKSGTSTGSVTRSGNATNAVTVQLTSSDTTEATVPATVTIPAGATSATFTVTAVDDTLVDGNQTVTISASATGLSSTSGTVTVTDDEVSSLTLALSPTTISEKNGSSQGTVTRSGSTTSSLTVSLTSSDLTEATVPVSVTIPAGASSATFNISAVDDSLVDGSQNVVISAAATGLNSGTATLVVTDDDQTSIVLTLTVSPNSISEKNGTAIGTVSRTGPLTSSLDVQIGSSDTTEATAPSTVTIPANGSSATFTINAVDDSLVDGSQTVTITANASGATGAQAALTVTDDEQPGLAITLAQSTISEKNGSTIATVTRTGSTSGSLVVQLASSDTTEATVPATVTIPAGASSATFTVTGVDDTTADGPQLVNLSASANNLQSGSATLQVTDDEQAGLTLVLNPTSIPENGGTSTATVTRSGDLSSSLVVSLASSDTSEATVPATLTIPAGQSNATFVITAVDDTQVDGTVSLNITATSQGLQSGSAELLVLDNEQSDLTLGIDGATYSEKAGTVTGTIVRNGSIASSLTVTLATSDSTIVQVPTTVAFAPGARSVSFSFTIVDDDLADGTQTASITATATGLQSETAVITVTDDDVAALTLELSPASISENGGRSTATVSRNTPLNRAVTVSIAVSNTTEVTATQQITIPAGSRTSTFVVSAINDDRLDGNLMTTITVSSTGLTSASKQIQVVDDDQSGLVLTLAQASISERNGSTTGTLRRPTATNSELVVTLTSSTTTAATVPATVVIPAGATSAVFTINSVDDALLDGLQSTTITASADGLASATQVLSVTDYETLSVVLPQTSISESSSPLVGSVIRSNADMDSALTVQLTSSVSTAAGVPTQVIIPAGQSFVNFSIQPVNDSLGGPDQLTTITAIAAGYVSITASLTVTDDDPKSWTNPALALDVNNDKVVTPIDVLLIINQLNTIGPRQLSTPSAPPAEFFDVSGDMFLSSLDALLIINHLNSNAGSEGEAAPAGSHDQAIQELVEEEWNW